MAPGLRVRFLGSFTNISGRGASESLEESRGQGGPKFTLESNISDGSMEMGRSPES